MLQAPEVITATAQARLELGWEQQQEQNKPENPVENHHDVAVLIEASRYCVVSLHLGNEPQLLK
jgi:hypothetical protein